MIRFYANVSSIALFHKQICSLFSLSALTAPLYPLQDFKALYKYCIIIIIIIIIIKHILTF